MDFSKTTFGVSRRGFIRSGIVAGVFLQFPWITSCTNEFIVPENLNPLDKSSFLDMRFLLGVLFPKEGFGPSAMDVNADTYILWVLNDLNIDSRENKYMVDKLNKFSSKIFSIEGERFSNLSYSKQKDLVNDLVKFKWADVFFSRLLTLLFEALLLHPLYNVNSNEVGWKWLMHQPGFPLPKEELSYLQLLEKKNEV